MAEYLIQDSTLTGIADAIRAKTGGSSALTPAQMVTEIGSIQTGGGGVPSYMRVVEVTVASAATSLSIPCDISVNAFYAISSEFVSRTVLSYQYILEQSVVPNRKPYAQIQMTLKADGSTDYWQNGAISYSSANATATINSKNSKAYYAAGVKYVFVLFNTSEVQ